MDRKLPGRVTAGTEQKIDYLERVVDRLLLLLHGEVSETLTIEEADELEQLAEAARYREKQRREKKT